MPPMHSDRLPVLRFAGHRHPDLPLARGMNRLCRDPEFDRGLILAEAGARSLIDFCFDERGLWLHVAEGVAGVHVNGRPVRSLALLHLGDGIHCEGVEMCVAQSAAALPEGPLSALPLPLLRGLCGPDHGRALVIDGVLRAGGGGEAIRLEQGTAAVAEIRFADGELLLQALSADAAVRVNGEKVTQARLHPGDQLQFAPDRRYLLEATPGRVSTTLSHTANTEAVEPAVALSREKRYWRIPWLLLAAIFSAAALAALLWFGVK